MTHSKFMLRFLVMAAIFAAPGGAAAAPAMDQAAMQKYGGVFAPDCPNYNGLQLKYLGDILVVKRAGKEVTAGSVRVSKTYPGKPPAPADFSAVLSGTVPGRDALTFTLFHNRAGLFAVVEGGPKTLAAIGPGVQGQRIRHCDPNRNRLPGAQLPVMVFAADLLRDRQFKALYVAALGALTSERWFMELTGPSPEAKSVQVAGRKYQQLESCKDHDCYDNNITMLYDVTGKTLYGQGVSRGRRFVLGAPPPAVARDLDRLWRVGWRSGG